MSSLYVLVELIQTDGVVAAVDYRGQQYFVNLEDIEHITDTTYSIATWLLRTPIAS